MTMLYDLIKPSLETLYMVFLSTGLACLLGLPMGVLLTLATLKG